MDILELKIITFGEIASNQKLTISEKIQLLNFVKECTDFQLIGLLETGRMQTEKELLLREQKSWSDKALNLAASKSSPQIAGADAAERALKQKAVERGLERSKERWASGETSSQQEPARHYNQPPSGGMGAGEAAAYGAAAIAAITAGILVYKRFFSKAARACKNLSGSSKTACMTKFKADGKRAEATAVMAKLSGCKNNPKCVAKIKSRVTKIKDEEKAIRAKIKK